MEENWKTLAIDNRYSISTNGNIISNVYKEPRRLHPVIDNRGYYYVRIKNKAYNVHRLVALTFIPTNDTTLHVDHIDGNKLNNHISNLRWCTQKENNNNPITRARISRRLMGGKRTPEQRERMSAAQRKAPAHYLLNYDEQLMLHSDCYMQNASEVNIKTILSFNARKEE